MKNLTVQQSKEIKVLMSVFNKEVDQDKKDLLSKEIIAKFGIDTFADAQKEIKKIASKKEIPAIDANVPKEIKSVPASLKVVPAKKLNKAEQKLKDANDALLLKLNAIGITDKLSAKGGKSIFKKEFNNKTDRTKCRNSFQNAIALYLMQSAKGKKDVASNHLKDAIAIADKYYIAGATFKNASDYCTDNMQSDKKELIKLFVEMQA